MILTCKVHHTVYEALLGGIGCPICYADRQDKESKEAVDRFVEALKGKNIEKFELKGGESMREVHVGDHVIWVDPIARPHNAIVTAVWNHDKTDCINVVMANDNADMTDNYGRQIRRETSQLHKRNYQVHGNYWMWPDEVQNPIAQPAER